MNKSKAKLYFLISTGEVLVITSEIENCMKNTSKEEDVERYQQLQGKNIDTIDFIELEYGTLATTFNNAKSYKVNPKTKQLEVTYYTQEELDEEKIKKQEKENVINKIDLISSYANLDNDSIDELTNYILQREINRIKGGII